MAAVSKERIVGAGKLCDQCMRVRLSGCGDDLCVKLWGIGGVSYLETPDVFTHAACQERNLLRKVSNVSAECVRVPVRNIDVVQADGAVVWLHGACGDAGKGRFSCAARADDAEDFTGSYG